MTRVHVSAAFRGLGRNAPGLSPGLESRGSGSLRARGIESTSPYVSFEDRPACREQLPSNLGTCQSSCCSCSSAGVKQFESDF